MEKEIKEIKNIIINLDDSELQTIQNAYDIFSKIVDVVGNETNSSCIDATMITYFVREGTVYDTCFLMSDFYDFLNRLESFSETNSIEIEINVKEETND